MFGAMPVILALIKLHNQYFNVLISLLLCIITVVSIYLEFEWNGTCIIENGINNDENEGSGAQRKGKERL